MSAKTAEEALRKYFNNAPAATAETLDFADSDKNRILITILSDKYVFTADYNLFAQDGERLTEERARVMVGDNIGKLVNRQQLPLVEVVGYSTKYIQNSMNLPYEVAKDFEPEMNKDLMESFSLTPNKSYKVLKVEEE